MNTPKYLIQNVEKYPNEPALSLKTVQEIGRLIHGAKYTHQFCRFLNHYWLAGLKNMIRLAFIVTTDLNGI